MNGVGMQGKGSLKMFFWFGKPVTPDSRSEPGDPLADSDESGHLFRFISDTDPVKADSRRSEATLWVKE